MSRAMQRLIALTSGSSRQAAAQWSQARAHASQASMQSAHCCSAMMDLLVNDQDFIAAIDAPAGSDPYPAGLLIRHPGATEIRPMDNATASERPGIDAVVVPRTTDLGDGFTVRRALPSAQRRMVGPFVFFDQMGPALL